MTDEMLTSIHEAIGECSPECPVCEGEGWVCEDHRGTRWRDGDGCCGGAGMPCPNIEKVRLAAVNQSVPSDADDALIYARLGLSRPRVPNSLRALLDATGKP